MAVPRDKIPPLVEISDSIVYYPLANDCGAGCHFRGAGVATLSIVKQYATGKLTLEQAIDAYAKRIARLSVENEAFDQAFVAGGIEATRGTTLRTDLYEQYVVDRYQIKECPCYLLFLVDYNNVGFALAFNPLLVGFHLFVVVHNEPCHFVWNFLR